MGQPGTACAKRLITTKASGTSIEASMGGGVRAGHGDSMEMIFDHEVVMLFCCSFRLKDDFRLLFIIIIMAQQPWTAGQPKKDVKWDDGNRQKETEEK